MTWSLPRCPVQWFGTPRPRPKFEIVGTTAVTMFSPRAVSEAAHTADLHCELMHEPLRLLFIGSAVPPSLLGVARRPPSQLHARLLMLMSGNKKLSPVDQISSMNEAKDSAAHLGLLAIHHPACSLCSSTPPHNRKVHCL